MTCDNAALITPSIVLEGCIQLVSIQPHILIRNAGLHTLSIKVEQPTQSRAGNHSKIMLPATFKLCCGISHQHFKTTSGLKNTAVVATTRKLRRMLTEEKCVPNTIDSLAQKDIFCQAFRVEEEKMKINSTLNTEELFYIKQGKEALQTARDILKQDDGWTTEIKMENGDTVVSKVLPGIGKVFKLEVVLDATTEQVYSELHEKVDKISSWNPSVKSIQILQKISNKTMVTYEMMGDTAGNIIGHRDFVSIRHCSKEGSCCYLARIATESKLMPPQKGFIRAETGPSCIILRPASNNKKKTQFTWLLSLDLKGWLPKAIINQGLSQAQVDFAEHLRLQLSANSSTTSS
ncbi:steroidogenic acute regulatory protein-like [Narcine bancroftii]|uniref:steroidogenic acute regulatory protein-like n=1 Tax=Narcine bancroftii TaxID=1343680 RepID=UPI003831496F